MSEVTHSCFAYVDDKRRYCMTKEGTCKNMKLVFFHKIAICTKMKTCKGHMHIFEVEKKLAYQQFQIKKCLKMELCTELSTLSTIKQGKSRRNRLAKKNVCFVEFT